MCGIAAIYAFEAGSRAIDRGELVSIRDRMRSRGPDGAGIWIDDGLRVGLAHRRLAIIDLDRRSIQPMTSCSGRFRITFNGEIYNYRELRRRLELQGVVFRTTSDTEVLLELYAQKGAAMLQELRGMFAFAIWDEEKRGLFIARDPFGIKPIYYSSDGGCIRIASQVKALLAGGKISTECDPIGRAGLFTMGNVPEPFTYYKCIKALPSGCSMWIDQDGFEEPTRYFSTAALWEAAEGKKCDPGEYRNQLSDLLRDSVSHHLQADVPVGVFLSAGLDSATIAGFTRESVSNFETLTLGFSEYSGSSRDEAPAAEAIAEHLGSLHETHQVAESDFIDSLDSLLDAMDQPTIDGVNMYFVCRAAHRRGLKVALSGVGGDELFGGYQSFKQLPLMRDRLSFSKRIPGLGKAFRLIGSPLISRVASPKYASVLEYGGSLGGLFFVRRGLFMPWELPELMGTEEARIGWSGLQAVNTMNSAIKGLSTDHARISVLESEFYMRNQLLKDTDWASMAHSLEVRVPLVDMNLWRGVAPMVVERGITKIDMAQSLQQPLPLEIVNRPKTGFSIPVNSWIDKLIDGKSTGRGLRGWVRHLDNVWRS